MAEKKKKTVGGEVEVRCDYVRLKRKKEKEQRG